MCRCGSPARLVLCETVTVCNCCTDTISRAFRGPTRVTECSASQRRISSAASCCAASSASETSGCRAAAMESDFGALMTTSAKRGDSFDLSLADRDVPIEVPVIGSVQSTQAA